MLLEPPPNSGRVLKLSWKLSLNEEIFLSCLRIFQGAVGDILEYTRIHLVKEFPGCKFVPGKRTKSPRCPSDGNFLTEGQSVGCLT